MTSISSNRSSENQSYYQSALLLTLIFIPMVFSPLERTLSYTALLTCIPCALVLLLIRLGDKERKYQHCGFWMMCYILISLYAVIMAFFVDDYPWQNQRQILLWIFGLSTLSVLLPVISFCRINALEMLLKLVKISIILYWVSVIIHARYFFNPGFASENYVLTCEYFADTRNFLWVAMLPIFCRKMFSSRVYYASWLAVCCNFIIAVICARRGNAFMCLVILFMDIALTSKRMKKISFIAVLLLLGIFINYNYVENDIFFLFRERMSDIVGARDSLYEAQLSQTSLLEFIFGKGIFGSYIGENYFFDETLREYLDVRRFASESGFMNIILHIGLTGLVIHVMALSIPVFKGIFRSRSTIALGMAIFITASLIDLIPYGLLSFNLYCVMIFMFVSLLGSENFLKLSDSEIMELIKKHEI